MTLMHFDSLADKPQVPVAVPEPLRLVQIETEIPVPTDEVTIVLIPAEVEPEPVAPTHEVHYQDDRVTIYRGDCIETMKALPDNSVDSIVTDPPYGLEFMGKEWDGADGFRRSLNAADAGRDSVFGRASRTSPEYRAGQVFQQFSEAWAKECLRVLKPGGHLLAFGGTRTFHRLAVAIEDAGFEIRDSIAWLYGSGFPKSLDVSKALDKAAGVEREDKFGGAIGRNIGPTGNKKCDECGKWLVSGSPCRCPRPQDLPKSDDAKTWQGWGTALKPAFEPIIMARKPLIGTVATNVLTHGTGALNIDATRIGYEEGGSVASNPSLRTHINGGNGGHIISTETERRVVVPNPSGRWPANVILGHNEDCEEVGVTTEFIGGGASATSGFVDGYEKGDGFVGKTVSSPFWNCSEGCQVAVLDQQSGSLKSGAGNTRRKAHQTDAMAGTLNTLNREEVSYGDTGGASRFFYCAKAPARERVKVDDVAHPTVKPLALMRWLVKLVTPPEGLVLEPFAGSGTTVEACIQEGFRCTAIERDASYLPLIDARIERNQ